MLYCRVGYCGCDESQCMLTRGFIQRALWDTAIRQLQLWSPAWSSRPHRRESLREPQNPNADRKTLIIQSSTQFRRFYQTPKPEYCTQAKSRTDPSTSTPVQPARKVRTAMLADFRFYPSSKSPPSLPGAGTRKVSPPRYLLQWIWYCSSFYLMGIITGGPGYYLANLTRTRKLTTVTY